MILSRVEERVTLNDDRFELATVQYPGTVHPRGFELLESFTNESIPEWRYRLGEGWITKTVSLLDGQQSVLVQYVAGQSCRLDVRILVAFRDYHGLSHANQDLQTGVRVQAHEIELQPYSSLPALTIRHSGEFQPDAQWFLNHEYLRELERGLDFREDLFSPGGLWFELQPDTPVWFVATLEPDRLPDGERKRRENVSPQSASSVLHRAFDQFRVTRADGQPSLLAGYPWFTDWSRDILISLPALTVAGFSDAEARQIITMLLEQRSQGILPNRFLDAKSEPEFNTADASLWFFVATRELLSRHPHMSFLRDTIFPAALDMLDWHNRGTHHNIHVDESDGLLWAGTPATQLTWMDARVDGVAVTPRFGKPVEINALWYNALRITAEWSGQVGDEENCEKLNGEADRALASFNELFWDEEKGYLYDVCRPDFRDASIRPNQLFAASLPHPCIDRKRAGRVIEAAERHLLTPVGLRTLAPEDPQFCPRFVGSMRERDRAYHQGTVWPWLVGPFISACLYAYDDGTKTESCREVVRQLEAELSACCLGSLSEVYDAQAPQNPGGCPAQLWSVAQLILARAMLE